MPSKSKAQQRFFGVVKGIQKGASGDGKAKKAANDMNPSDVDDFASTKHKGLPNRIKRETKVRSLIRKMVREMMAEDFAGAYPKSKRKSFDKKRQKQSEVLGYKLTGKSDVKTEIDNATIKEQKINEVDFDKVIIPGKVKRFLDRFVDSMKDAKLNRIRRSAILYKVIQASGMSPKTLMADIQRIKRGLTKENSLGDAFHRKIDSYKKKIEKEKEAYRKAKERQKDRNNEVTEAISGSDRKIMMMIVRDIIENLKKAGAKKPSNQVGRGVLGVLRAMTYSKDNANYKNYKKYFPKTFNSKLTQKRVAQFHTQTDKVQLTMVKQAMNKVLGEGKLTEAHHTIFHTAEKVMKDKQAYKYKSKKGMVMVDMQSANLLTKVWKKVNPKMKKILSDLGEKNPGQLMKTLWAVVK